MLKIPIEWYVLFMPSFLLLLLLWSVASPEQLAFFSPGVILSHLLKQYFTLPFFILLVVVLTNFISRAFIRDTKNTHARRSTKSFLISFATLFIPYMTTLVVVSISVSLLFTSQIQEIVSFFSTYYFLLDTKLFGEQFYVSLITNISSLPFLPHLLAWAYHDWIWLLALLFFGLVFRSIRLFRFFFFSFFITLTLGMPFWYAAPAVSPLELAVYPSLSLDQNELVADTGEQLRLFAKDNPEHIWTTETLRLKKFWEGGSDYESFAVSSNPSMHVAIGMILVFFAFHIGRWFCLLFVVWQIPNCIATVYLLQHYTIDIPSGVLMGLLGIALARCVLWIEDSFMRVSEDTYFGLLTDIKEGMFLFITNTKRDVKSIARRVGTQNKRL